MGALKAAACFRAIYEVEVGAKVAGSPTKNWALEAEEEKS